MGVDAEYFEQKRQTGAENARQKADRYRAEQSEPDLAGKTVDDGVATGSTVRASLKILKKTDAERIVVAVPVSPPDTIQELETMADGIICLIVITASLYHCGDPCR